MKKKSKRQQRPPALRVLAGGAGASAPKRKPRRRAGSEMGKTRRVRVHCAVCKEETFATVYTVRITTASFRWAELPANWWFHLPLVNEQPARFHARCPRPSCSPWRVERNDRPSLRQIFQLQKTINAGAALSDGQTAILAWVLGKLSAELRELGDTLDEAAAK